MKKTRLSTDLLPGFLRPDTYQTFDLDGPYDDNGDYDDGLRDKYNHDDFKKDLYKYFIRILTGDVNDYLNTKFKCRILEKEGETTLHSPQYYNFGTDWINFDFEYSPDSIMEYIKKNKEALSEFIKSEYTSGDGFMSFTANNYDALVADLQEDNSQALGAVICFALESYENKHDVLENFYNEFTIYDYLTLP